MRTKLFLLILACLAVSIETRAQGTPTAIVSTGPTQADATLIFSATSPGISPTLSVLGIGAIEVHRIAWSVSPTPLTTCTFSIDYSSDQGNTWVAGGIVNGQSCTSNSALPPLSVVVSSAIRINVTAISGGTVTINYAGWRYRPFNSMVLGNGAIGANPGVGTVTPSVARGINFAPAGNFVHLSGYGYLDSADTFTTTTTIPFVMQYQDSGPSQGCYATLTSNAGTGTTPTMDVYIEDNADGSVNYNDRVHFNQVTTSASKQYAFITAHATPGAMSAGNVTADAVGTMLSRALAAGSVVQGMLGPNLRVDVVITGTTPSFTGVNIGIWCN